MKEFLAMQELDKKAYQEHELGFKNLKLENVNNEEKAITFLLCVEHNNFMRFYKLQECVENNNESDDIKLSTTDERFFIGYIEFLSSKYPKFYWKNIINVFRSAKSFNFWSNNFASYIQNLHDKGFIFKEIVYSELEKLDIRVKYTEHGWARKFYKRWINYKSWTLKEAVCLFKGEDPEDCSGFYRQYLMYIRESNHIFFHDISQNPENLLSKNFFDANSILPFSDKQPLAWDILENSFVDLEERLRRARLGNHMSYKKCKEKGEYLYVPEEIVRWLLENTLHTPPKALLQVLKIDESEESEKQSIKENQKVPRKLKKPRKNLHELHKLIGIVIVKLGFKDKTAPANDIWKHIEISQTDDSCIQKVEESKIFWISYRGKEQVMQRERFNTVVSEFNTGKKEYPK